MTTVQYSIVAWCIDTYIENYKNLFIWTRFFFFFLLHIWVGPSPVSKFSPRSDVVQSFLTSVMVQNDTLFISIVIKSYRFVREPEGSIYIL